MYFNDMDVDDDDEMDVDDSDDINVDDGDDINVASHSDRASALIQQCELPPLLRWQKQIIINCCKGKIAKTNHYQQYFFFGN